MRIRTITGLARLGMKARILEHPIARHPGRLYNALLGDAARGDPAAYLQIELTSLCNLGCGYCLQHAGKGPGELHRAGTRSGNMSQSAYRKALDDHPSVVALQLQGQGEPLLHPQFARFVEEAKRRGIFTYTVSNGTLLDEERREEVLGSGLDAYLVSLDASRPEEMERMRRGLDYDLVVKNVRALREAREARDGTMLIGISGVVRKSDRQHLEERILALDREIEPDFMVFAPLATCDAAHGDYTNWYGPGLKEETLDRLVLPRPRGVKAVIFTASGLSNAGNVCKQTRMAYIHYNGSAAYCQIRHKTTVEDPAGEMRRAARMMLAGTTPPGCEGCGLLPTRLKG